MRRNLFTDSQLQNVVMMTPNTNTATAVISSTCGVMTFITSGSYLDNTHTPVPSTAMATMPARSPMPTALLRNGARMNPHEAPTSFIVWMLNLRA